MKRFSVRNFHFKSSIVNSVTFHQNHTTFTFNRHKISNNPIKPSVFLTGPSSTAKDGDEIHLWDSKAMKRTGRRQSILYRPKPNRFYHCFGGIVLGVLSSPIQWMAVGRNPITVCVVSQVKGVGGASSLRAGLHSRRSQWPIALGRGAWRKSRIDQSGSFSSVSGSQPFLCSWQARKMNPFLITSSSVRLFIYHREVVVASVRPVFDELVFSWSDQVRFRHERITNIGERECSLPRNPAAGLRSHDNPSKEGVLKDSWRLVGGGPDVDGGDDWSGEDGLETPSAGSCDDQV